MVNIRRPGSDELPPEGAMGGGSEGSGPPPPMYSKAYIKDTDWKQISFERLRNVTIGRLLSGEIRLMLEIKVDGRKAYIVCDDTDLANLKKKSPAAIVIHLKNVFKAWTAERSENYPIEALPKICMAMDRIDGAKIIENFVDGAA